MAYGTIKVDNITFTNGGVDQTIAVSGVVQSISGDITATGTIQGATIIGTSTVSGATVTGDAGQFTTATITSGVFASGTAAAPSVSVGTTDNGIYSPGTDQVAISTNGTGQLFVTSSGNVGVGTTSPSNKFVVSTSNQGLEVSPGSTNTLLSYDRGATAYLPIRTRASSHAFSNAGTDFATIDSSGRLLVGTTSTSVTSTLVLEGNSVSSSSQANLHICCGTTTPTNGQTIGLVVFGDGNQATGAQIAAIADASGWASGSNQPTRLVLYTNPGSPTNAPTEQLRITSDRYVRLASGTGGIQFGGDTAATNALDDYEEGTWTPTIVGTTSAGTASYSGQTGVYTKIGNMVTVYCGVGWSGGTGTGNLRVQGLPFTSNQNFVTALGASGNLNYTLGQIPYGFTSSSNVINIGVSTPNTGAASLAYDSAGSLFITLTYFVS